MPLLEYRDLALTKITDPAKLRYKKGRLVQKREVLEVMMENNRRELQRLCSRMVDLNTQIAVLDELLLQEVPQ